MRITRLDKMTGGWFVGDFAPAAFRTDSCEVCWKTHPKGERWPTHFHKVATEINLLVRGRMVIQGQELIPGDIFVIDPGEIADPEFLEDCEVVVVKTPSVQNDKYIIAEAQDADISE